MNIRYSVSTIMAFTIAIGVLIAIALLHIEVLNLRSRLSELENGDVEFLVSTSCAGQMTVTKMIKITEKAGEDRMRSTTSVSIDRKSSLSVPVLYPSNANSDAQKPRENANEATGQGGPKPSNASRGD